ncbi:GPI ethanolamine phosphate transferase 2 isoform X3 [Quercus robur]|uniref:GPI ethanolamine phosphate transferase 2 isoform X3 n=1 Tax=Quercus robur TaxID=38942 RepID=UPI0021612D98|nr:GPI ethanolamine phosphate transferase 2 isoform X3 [Quercus robur]
MSSSLTCTRLTILTITGVTIQIIGLSLFVYGFFPVKPALSGVSGAESFRAPTCTPVHNQTDSDLPPHNLKSLYEELSGIAPFDRLVLMVIDGLPAEFVLGKDDKPPPKALMDAMPYTQSLLANGMAIGYHAKAAPPTVTMPRLKAMVSGAIGGFLDVAFNFNTQALLDDNLLGQFLKIGWKMVMFGDETWLKLFPGLFTRHDGVGSFFVKDTVQVDQNVSRHLGDELSRDDWDLMVLHYLGLDHVGHIGGRNSILTAPKLLEMDKVVNMIHTSVIADQENGQGQTLLVVVSDHGMTYNGNHGGSSFEETDSLALFIGLRNDVSDYALYTLNTVYQVDIAPTLALLFGVPIPKNNVGVLLSGTFGSFTDDQQLKALELNSWQLLRLLQAQLPGLSCENSLCDGFSDDQGFRINKCSGNIENTICCLYLKATMLHSSWRLKDVSSRSYSREDYSGIVAAYYEFLKTASEWLSRRVTDKPVNLLAFGVAAMMLSCLILLSLIFSFYKEVYNTKMQQCFDSKYSMHTWSLDETFVLGVILILVVSMGSSSMVEEEQYIWHFVTSTLNMLLLRKMTQSLLVEASRSLFRLYKENKKIAFQMCSIFVLIISGRTLRGWHQGGVNWTYLPDISKWLEKAGSNHVKSIQLVSGLLMISLCLFALSLSGSRRKISLVVGFSFLMFGLLVLQHIQKYQDNIFASSNYNATLLAQIIFAGLGIATIGTFVAYPWLMPICVSKIYSSHHSFMSGSVPIEIQNEYPLLELKNSLYLIGWAYLFCWCLLQLLLQQPINALPMLLLFVQILASLIYASNGGVHHKQWVEIAALYYLGMAGHFALGNSNTLATIDVAGAFIGMSSYSTLLSGILMFIITYASPSFFLLSIVMYISVDTSYLVIPQKADSEHLLKNMLAFPCLVPLGVNSIILTAYTIVLLLMRNHLFVWSVFSPKYLYVCATTLCVYIGVSFVAATVIYSYLVLALRKRMQGFSSIDTR